MTVPAAFEALQEMNQVGQMMERLGTPRTLAAPGADGHSAAANRGSPYRLGQSIEVGLAAVDEHIKRVDFFLPGAERRNRPDDKRTKGRPAADRSGPKGKTFAKKNIKSKNARQSGTSNAAKQRRSK